MKVTPLFYGVYFISYFLLFILLGLSLFSSSLDFSRERKASLLVCQQDKAVHVSACNRRTLEIGWRWCGYHRLYSSCPRPLALKYRQPLSLVCSFFCRYLRVIGALITAQPRVRQGALGGQYQYPLGFHIDHDVADDSRYNSIKPPRH